LDCSKETQIQPTEVHGQSSISACESIAISEKKSGMSVNNLLVDTNTLIIPLIIYNELLDYGFLMC